MTRPLYVRTELDPVTGQIAETVAESAYAHSDSGPLTVDQAHAVMREHLDCDMCRIRRTARAVLIEAGDLTPATVDQL